MPIRCSPSENCQVAFLVDISGTSGQCTSRKHVLFGLLTTFCKIIKELPSSASLKHYCLSTLLRCYLLHRIMENIKLKSTENYKPATSQTLIKDTAWTSYEHTSESLGLIILHILYNIWARSELAMFGRWQHVKLAGVHCRKSSWTRLHGRIAWEIGASHDWSMLGDSIQTMITVCQLI